MNDSLISIRALRKKFNGRGVLEDIHLEVKEREVLGLLGINGAGKTTLIRSILGLVKIDRGQILFKNQLLKPEDIHTHFGFLPENFLPPPHLKGREFLKIMAEGLKVDFKKVDYLLERIGLKESEEKYIKSYSKGMIQRLGLACALLKDPQVLILDEPTLGLDPLGQKQLLEILAEMNKLDKTIFFSSHILSQIEKICHRIAILHLGKIRFIGNIEEILKKHNTSSLEEAFLKEIEELK